MHDWLYGWDDLETSSYARSSRAKPDTSILHVPSLGEWSFRNDRAKGMIEAHIADLPSIVPDVDKKTAAEVLNYLVSEFGKTDDMRKTYTIRRLRNPIFRDNETLDSFFKILRELRKEAMDAGNDISDGVFREIILAAFPTVAFDTIMQNIMANPVTFATSSSVASSHPRHPEKKCTNPNCLRSPCRRMLLERRHSTLLRGEEKKGTTPSAAPSADPTVVGD
jgi:hypothetical protein